MATPATRSGGASALALRIAVVAALAVSAYAHFKLAKTYEPVGKDITQGTLFRVQGVLATLAALLLAINARPVGWVPAFFIGAGSLFASLLYRYVTVGRFGPLPTTYHPL